MTHYSYLSAFVLTIGCLIGAPSPTEAFKVKVEPHIVVAPSHTHRHHVHYGRPHYHVHRHHHHHCDDFVVRERFYDSCRDMDVVVRYYPCRDAYERIETPACHPYYYRSHDSLQFNFRIG